MNARVYQQITERIIALRAPGTVPWHKPWKARTRLPRNFVSQKPYRGINVFRLLAMSYESPFWLTFRQAWQQGRSVRKGEKSCPVVFWKKTTIEDEASGQTKEIRVLRLYRVFNVAQCEGLKRSTAPIETPLNGVPKPAEIVAQMPQPPLIKHGMVHAGYSPREDCVAMPLRERFEREEEYYSTRFHELVHPHRHDAGRLHLPGQLDRLVWRLRWNGACDLCSAGWSVRTVSICIHSLVDVATGLRVRQHSSHLSVGLHRDDAATPGIVPGLGSNDPDLRRRKSEAEKVSEDWRHLQPLSAAVSRSPQPEP